MSLWSNIRKRGLKDILNPYRWVLFARAKVREESGTIIDIGGGESLKVRNEELQSYIEQIIYRQSFSDCGDCLKNGQCTHCGCKTPDLFYDKEMVCSGGNWNVMLSPDQWEEFKKDLGIKIGVIWQR